MASNRASTNEPRHRAETPVRESGAPTSGVGPVSSASQTTPGESNDVDAAKALLFAGADGVQLWNARRKRERRRLNLDGLDLSGLKLASIDLQECSLRYAKLNNAVLIGAQLSRSDLTGANLTGAHLEGATLIGARLLNARLTEATLRWCNLSTSDLRNANLQGAALDPCHLGGADLTGAQFSSAALGVLDERIDDLEAAGQHPRSVFFALLGLCAFAVLTAAASSDVDLITGVGHIHLPVLDSEVSPPAFFFTAPVVCTALMLYVAIHLKQLRVAASELPARFTDGTTLSDKLTPWMQNVAPLRVVRLAVQEDGSDAGWMIPAISKRLLIFTTHWIVPASSALVLVAYFRARNAAELGLLSGLTALIWLLSFALSTGGSGERWRGRRLATFFAVLALSAGAVAGIGCWTAGPLQARGKDLSGQTLANRNLRRADLSRANLKGTVFNEVDLAGALLLAADLRAGGGRGVELYRARLNGSDLSDAYFAQSNFEGAQMVKTRLQNSELQDVSLRGADLTNANLGGAHLYCVDLRGANLSETVVDGTEVRGLRCDADTRGLQGPQYRALREECARAAERAQECHWN